MLDTKFVEQEAIGLYRCDNDPESSDFCSEYRVILVKAARRLLAACSNQLVNNKGCSRRWMG